MPLRARNYERAETFLQRAQGYLEERESLNNLILGLAIRLHEHPDWEEFPVYLSTIETQQGEIVLAAVMTPPKNIILAGSEAAPEAAYHLLVEDLIANRWQPPGVNAPNPIAEGFAHAWGKAKGLAPRVLIRERAYELRKVNPIPYSPGRLRSANESDLDLLADWRAAFLEEALTASEKKIQDHSSRKIIARRIAVGDAFVWENQAGEIVSMSIRARPTPHGATVTSVYTPPALRGKGYASSCVAALSQHILSSGKQFCNLFTDLSNSTSNSIYMKLGYFPIGDFTLYTFEPPDENA